MENKISNSAAAKNATAVNAIASSAYLSEQERIIEQLALEISCLNYKIDECFKLINLRLTELEEKLNIVPF